MGLRSRLALFFIAIVVVPLAIAILFMDRDSQDATVEVIRAQVSQDAAAADLVLGQVRQRAVDTAEDLATTDVGRALADGQRGALQAQLENLPLGAGGRSDFVIVAGPGGQVLAARTVEPSYAGSFTAPTPEQIASGLPGDQEAPGLLLASRRVVSDDGVLGFVATGLWLDEMLLSKLRLELDMAFCNGSQMLATSALSPPCGALEMSAEPVRLETADGGGAIASAIPLGPLGDHMVLWSGIPQSGFTTSLLLFAALAVLLAGVIGWFLAGTVVAPVRRAAEVARAVAGGDLRRKIEPTGGKELEELAGALNTMGDDLGDRMGELEHSRDVLRGSLARLGETLSSSLDLNRTLSVVTETAMDTLNADRAALYLLTPERDALYTKVGRGIGDEPTMLPVGQGRLGWVAEHGRPLLLSLTQDEGLAVPEPQAGEPQAPHELIVPMSGRGRVLGALALLRDAEDAPFTQADLHTIRSFAAQASVAIENVILHREAQRLSVTDTLTGLWNFRHFQMEAEREFESAARFHRPLSLLVIDVDHFKRVNDAHGHQVGDRVLKDVAGAIHHSTRVPDVVARYGGEEFVVLLPGTATDGAVTTAERVRESTRATTLPEAVGTGAGEPPTVVTCSVGVAVFPEHGRTLSELLRAADAAMYAAKQQGRDRVRVADEEIAVISDDYARAGQGGAADG